MELLQICFIVLAIYIYNFNYIGVLIKGNNYFTKSPPPSPSENGPYEFPDATSTSRVVLACSMRAVTSSTIIAKLMSAPASHSTTAFDSLNPEFTLWALFELCASNKLFKFFIFLTIAIVDPILFTSHSFMVFAPAAQTVMFLANWAAIII